MLFGRRLQQCNDDLSNETIERSSLTTTKLDNIIQHFWKRWRCEYLTALREQQNQRTDKRNCPNIKVGDVVIIEEEHQPRTSWRIAIIDRLISGHDDCVRGAVLRLPNSTYIRRPIFKLYLIESVRKKEQFETYEPNQREHKQRRESAIAGEIKSNFF